MMDEDLQKVSEGYHKLGSLCFQLGNFAEAEQHLLSSLEYNQGGDKTGTILLLKLTRQKQLEVERREFEQGEIKENKSNE